MTDTRPKMTFATDVQFLPGVGPERAERLHRLGLRTARDVLFYIPRGYDRPPPDRSIGSLRDGQPASIVGTITDAELASRTPGRSVFAAIVENETGAARIVFFNQPFRADQISFGMRVQVSGTPRLKGLRMEFTHPQVKPLGEEESAGEAGIDPVYPLTEGIKQAELRRLTRAVAGELAGEVTEVLPEGLRRRAAEALAAADVGPGEDAGLAAADVGPGEDAGLGSDVRLRGAEDRDGAGEGSASIGTLVVDRLPPIDVTLREIHTPSSESGLAAARLRLVFQELLVMQLALAIRRRRLTTELRAPPLPPTPVIHSRILNRFPFELTGDQRRAIGEIGRDMSRQFPMNRLLQGDVGSGKTVVALYAMLLAVAHRHQAVLMAPTEILARQHHATLGETLAASRVRVGLLCGSLTAAERREVVRGAERGEIDLLVGTQSLLHGGLKLPRLGVCVIDEQHKFGVRQRVSLRGDDTDPHCLVMSATPIPRSIAMTLFGDVELTTIRELPPGRGEVRTYLAHDGWKERWWAFVRQRLDEGRQAYVVAPRVSAGEGREGGESDRIGGENGIGGEDGEAGEDAGPGEPAGEDIASVSRTFDELSGGPLRGYRVALLHGRMSAEEKREVMRAFHAGEVRVLVSTTVIEVGIDVPNATVMTIVGGNRFGLAQLHQLRGRVSRGVHAGHVCVFSDGAGSPEEHERLRVFEQTGDGFALAEADFRLRGPGELLGRRQSGMPSMRIADLVRDQPILAVARELAQEMIDDDPDLEGEGLAELRRQVMRRYEKRLELGDVA